MSKILSWQSPRGPRRATALFIFVALGATVFLAAAGQKQEAQAIVAGTVFDSNGRSLPGCTVVVISEADAKQRNEGTTDRRGEFAIRVPAGRFSVTASAKGFESQQKTVQVEVGEKSTTTFLLSAR